MRTCAVNIRNSNYDVLIDRRSKWGNPFKTGTREENIAAYREWLPTQKHLMAALPELKGKLLGCWCKPKPCHGDVLVEFVELYCKDEQTEPTTEDRRLGDQPSIPTGGLLAPESGALQCGSAEGH